MANCLVAQSGGPTTVINASLAGVVRANQLNPVYDHVYGGLNGIEGILEDRLYDLTNMSEYENRLLRQTPSSALGSYRYKLKRNDETDYRKLVEIMDKHDIEILFYIGGNDSMDTVSKLSRYAAKNESSIRFIGIPKTIDNDLVMTDHTPGFGSAAKYVASTVREIAVDASVYDNKPSVTIVEIMGRHAGWLTAASALARKFEGDNPVLIYLPETAFDKDRFLSQVQDALKKTTNLVVCISEGIHDAEGTFICEYASEVGTDLWSQNVDRFRKISGKPCKRYTWY